MTEMTPPPVVVKKRFSVRDFVLGICAGVVLTFGGLVAFVAVIGALMSSGVSDVTNFAPAPEFPSSGENPVYGVVDASWTFHTLDGQPTTLADYKGKVVFLNFWATWCGPCVREMPSIKSLREKVQNDNVAFVLVSNEDGPKIESFLKSKDWGLTSFRMEHDAPALLETDGIPTTFIVDPTGRVVFRHIGMARWDDDSTVTYLRSLGIRK